MINYSIVMRSVNANLLEINQAKSRINQAKKEGTTPDPKDLELVKTEKQNAFAISQYTDIMTIEKFAKHLPALPRTSAWKYGHILLPVPGPLPPDPVPGL